MTLMVLGREVDISSTSGSEEKSESDTRELNSACRDGGGGLEDTEN